MSLAVPPRLRHAGVAGRADVRRVMGALAGIAAPLVVLVLYVSSGLLWVVVVALGLLVLATVAGRAALRGDLGRMIDGLPSSPCPEPVPGTWCPPVMREGGDPDVLR